MQAVHASGIQHNWDIYTNDGERLGTAKQVTETYVVVEKGRIFKHDLYIPLTSFMEADETEHRGTLSVNHDEVDSMGWETPPGNTPGSDGGPAANDLPPVTDTDARARPELLPERGEAPIDRPESAQPSIETEPTPIDS